MKKLLFSALIICAVGSGAAIRAEISEGRWEYDVFLNGARIGKSTVSSSVKNGNYENLSEMAITLNGVTTTVTQKIVETREYRPVRFESLQSVQNGGQVTAMEKIAEFRDGSVILTEGDRKTTIRISEPFVLDGNFFQSELEKKGYAKGVSVTARSYDPTIETASTFSLKVSVLGMEDVTVRGKTRRLNHMTSYIDSVKLADFYTDEKGVAEKIELSIMGNIIEMALK